MKPIRCFAAWLTSFALAFVCLSSGAPNAGARSAKTLLPGVLKLERTNLAEGPIIVKLHLEDGQELPLKLDTGSQVTFLDESLVPKLGRRRGTTNSCEPFGGKPRSLGIYSAPKLYAGDTQLLTGPRVSTRSLEPEEKGTLGILGMDCLRHYCIQFDFVAGEMRFLDPEHLDSSELGTPFALKKGWADITYFEADLFGQGKMRFMLDTGWDTYMDGMIDSNVFERIFQKYPNHNLLPGTYLGFADGQIAPGKLFPNLKVCGQNYTDLDLCKSDLNALHIKGVIGMRFLARHRVTLNYPKHTLYLKCVTGAPLAEGSVASIKKSPQATGATPTVSGSAGNSH